MDRRRADVRHERSQAAAGQRLRARPAGRRGREVIRARHRRAAARRCRARRARRPSPSPAARWRSATGRSRSRTARSSSATGEIVAAGDVRMKLPAGHAGDRRDRQMGDPGHRRRLLAARPGRRRPCRPRAPDDTTRQRPVQRRDRRRRRRSIRSTRPIAVNRADGVTRAIVAPAAGRSIFAGQGAVIDTGADMDPITAARDASSSSSSARPAPTRRADRASSAHVLFRNALREAAELRRYARRSRARAEPDERDRRSSATPTNRASTAPTRGAARTCC